ncbi:hypothetical protein GGR58DRAFT_500854 [Xylaria digitata]|nr:hypothetical protein GGR58DRAFT_500854 [Xylaria digitata]
MSEYVALILALLADLPEGSPIPPIPGNYIDPEMTGIEVMQNINARDTSESTPASSSGLSTHAISMAAASAVAVASKKKKLAQRQYE